jgi:hypothetical protein
MRRPALRVFATLAVATGTWSAVAVNTAAASAPSISHHPRISAGIRATGWASSNWSGYAITGGPFTRVTASWVVPSVSATRKATYSSNWVGIDGFNDSNLIQTGTESDYFSGSAHYNAWWEILPAPETRISMTVSPGDHMSASITQGANNQWTISITDTTTNTPFSIVQTYSAPLSSAEWIEEAPSIGGRIAPLAHYSSPALFDPGTANGGNPGLTAANGGVMIQNGAQVSTPSVPDSDTDGFNISYGSTAPSPPGS